MPAAVESKRNVGAAMSDDDVRRFIRERLRAEPDLRHTRMLRDLRDGGRACEQKRFRRLFMQVRDTP
jgi:hypothetical protein